MKTLCLLFLTVFLAFAFAEDSTQQASLALETSKKTLGVTKSTKAYRKAKEECLKKSDELKGKKLTDCIVDYQKEVK